VGFQILCTVAGLCKSLFYKYQFVKFCGIANHRGPSSSPEEGRSTFYRNSNIADCFSNISIRPFPPWSRALSAI